ncbi:MAG: SpoIIE family protein phosphatase [Bacteroidota bacterium]
MINPFEKFSARTIRIIFTVITLATFALSVHAFLQVMVFEVTSNDQCGWNDVRGRQSHIIISDVLPGGVAEKAGIRNGDTLVAINGKPFVNSGFAQVMLNQISRGEYATYSIHRGTMQFETKIEILKSFNVLAVSMSLLGFGFLLVGYVVVMTKPRGKVQRMFGWYGIYTMLFFGITNVSATLPPWLRIVYISALVVGHGFSPPMFVLFFLHFPVRRKVLDKKWLKPLLYTLSIVYGITFLQMSRNFSTSVIGTLLSLVPLFFFIEGLVEFTKNYFKYVDRQRRDQLLPILAAASVTVVCFTYLFVILAVNPFLFFLRPWVIAPIALIVGLPLAFGYSIFRYRLMDIDFIIKRSLIYGAVTATIAAVYLLIVVGVGQLVGLFFHYTDNRTLNIVAFMVIAFIFDPVKRKTQGWIDRVFYQERLNYQQALLEFSRELPRQMDMEQILQSIINTISTAMHVEKMAVAVCDIKEGCLAVGKNIPQKLGAFENEPGGLMALLQQTRKPLSLVLIGEEGEQIAIHEADKKQIIDSNIVLSVPMFMKERLIGAINVGPKLSGKVYSQDDIDLLGTVAGQAAIAIENARLHESELEKKRMEEELSIARKIQQGLLPKSDPKMKELDIAGVSIPALSVGGDYYDYIPLNGNRLLIVVADVSGKGMSAALYMSKIQGMIQLAAHLYHSPKEMLEEVNRRIYDGIERKSFITMILGLFDLNRKEVILCRAGHNKALVSVDGQMHFAEAGGIGLGLEPGPIFERYLEEVRIPLVPGNLFLFYSDGLTEAMNEKDEQFGEETVCDLVAGKRDLPAAQIQAAILQSVEKFRGAAEVHDDISLVAVKVR